jgi:ligand-binding SRPBCC domain-containing protein
MGLQTMVRQQKLPINIEKAWEFISSPENLKKITPPNMGFNITSEFPGGKMYAGMIISYIVKPVLRIPIRWVTEITHIQEPQYFVDEQRFGPYSFWHHKHFLKEISGGVEMTDTVHYKVPFWFIGDFVNFLFIRKQLSEIFNYRCKKLEELFGKYPEDNKH